MAVTTTDIGVSARAGAKTPSSWHVQYGDRVVIEAHLDRALARALGVSPGSTLELARRILSASGSDPPPG